MTVGPTPCRCGCGRPTLAGRSYLQGHNRRVPLETRFWRLVDRRGPDECWPWRGWKDAKGYGHFYTHGAAVRNQCAHRVAYELVVGPIPGGLQLDHLCGNPSCVNPAHLEPVTPAENNRRSRSVTAANARKTHCKRGHELTPENTYVESRGSRHCRACKRARDGRYRAARTLEHRQEALL